MEIKGRFDHFNFNVTDLEASIAFYGKALGLKEVKRKVAPDETFILVYLGDGKTDFTLELTLHGTPHIVLSQPGIYRKEC